MLKSMRTNLGILAVTILTIAIGLLIFLIYDISSTEKSLAKSLIQKPMQSAEIHLNSFFAPVEDILLTSRDHGLNGSFDPIAYTSMNSYFAPLISHMPQVSSMGIAHDGGYEFDVLPDSGNWVNREVWIDHWQDKEHWNKWTYDSSINQWKFLSSWEGTVKHDPRERPWYRQAIKNESDHIAWTEPYIYNTTFEVGITASVSFQSPQQTKEHVLAFDLTLNDITKFTQQLHVSPQGRIFVLSKEGKLIGLPQDKDLTTPQAIQKALLKMPHELHLKDIDAAYKHWKKNKLNTSFEFEGENDYLWSKLIKYKLSDDNYLIVGVIIPESDILGEVQRTKRIIIGSFIFVLILTGFVLYSYTQSKKANFILADKNAEISFQHKIIEEKNNEIIDSINYAQRIQAAILPQNHVIKNTLPDSFILYKPKDIVAGDFYWLQKKDDKIIFAAADCTGHGVPGAIVSVVCNGGLNRSVREYGLTSPNKILDQTKAIVEHEFEKSGSDNEDVIRDGMDIALCTLHQNMTLEFAGANNPLWLLRKYDNIDSIRSEFKDTNILEHNGYVLIEIEADKQPIGKYFRSNPYTNHTITLQKGDTFYLFSDGYADQFGGPRGKKFNYKSFKKLLIEVQELSMEEQKSELNRVFENWRGAYEQLDDVCVIGVRV